MQLRGLATDQWLLTNGATTDVATGTCEAVQSVTGKVRQCRARLLARVGVPNSVALRRGPGKGKRGEGPGPAGALL